MLSGVGLGGETPVSCVVLPLVEDCVVFEVSESVHGMGLASAGNTA